MWRNTRRVFTGTSYKAHLAMAVKLLEIPPEVEGAVVECGCYRGGSTANLSLVCEHRRPRADRLRLVRGPAAADAGRPVREAGGDGLLPAATSTGPGERTALGRDRPVHVPQGLVQRHPAAPHRAGRAGASSTSTTRPSLDDCIVNLWPHLTDQGYVFIDEYVLPDYCALFWSERYWRTCFDTHPPGLIGSGSGIGDRRVLPGPVRRAALIQDPTSIAYTRKDIRGFWDYYPDAEVARRRTSLPTPVASWAWAVANDGARRGHSCSARRACLDTFCGASASGGWTRSRPCDPHRLMIKRGRRGAGRGAG